jgi:hypothetical protein
LQVPKQQRLAEFFRRLAQAAPAASADQALLLIARTLTAVEDAFTDIPADPIGG